MVGKVLFFLSAVTASFLALSAGAITTSQNVDIIVTHGAALTTFTLVNNSGATLPAGTPVSFGQGFRYGDVMPGTYPLIRDAATHVALPGQQWDEISTWRENGGNGSWRHAVWGAWLPTSVAAGATYQVEFIVAAGAYSESSRQALAALCSGPAAHDLKIHLTDVRNQDDTMRDSGDATFRLCGNIANVGRDAPRHQRAGNVYDEYQVNGMFVYTSGHQDPLLYAQCNVDIFTQSSDGVSPGDVRWVCHIINGFMNVAAGSTGNAGNPGPAGFANDPQAVSYRPEVDDGSSDILDWSNLDATITSASNPIQPAGSVGCDTSAGNYCMFVAGSIGTNAWYDGQATRTSCSGTCPAGITNGQLYYVWPAGQAGSRSFATPASQYVALQQTPSAQFIGASSAFMTGAQGTGTTTFSTRVQNFHWQAWQTFDASGQNNWSPFGTTTRVTRKVYPAFTPAEKLYWEASGAIIPLNLTQPLSQLTPSPAAGQSALYQPGGNFNVIGGQGVGNRPDIGISNEWAAQAFINGTETNWDYARLFTLGTSIHGANVIVNEATGRIPVLNNGPPVGAGGNGVGGSYASLGAPQTQVELYGGGNNTLGVGLIGLADVPHGSPEICCGTHYYGTYLSHVPNFNGFTYMIFGDRHWLDLMRWRANADYAQQRAGPGPEAGEGYYRDNNAVYTDGNTYHYYGLMLGCCQNRGAAWMRRDITYPATFGGDGDIERSYFADFRKETDNYEPAMEAWLDGPGSTAYRTSVNLPDSNGDSVGVEYFIEAYEWEAEWLGLVWQHQPMSSRWMTRYQRYQEGILGGQLPGAPVSYYGVSYTISPAIHIGNYSGGSSQGGNLGPGMNGTDASDYGVGITGNTSGINAGGQIGVNTFIITAGDKVQNVVGWRDGASRIGITIDQLGAGWYTILGPVDNTQTYHTFYIQCPLGHAVDATCPTPGQAFTGFTSGGSPITGQYGALQLNYRPQYDPGANGGYQDVNYDKYAGQINNGLQIAGYSVAHAQADFAFRDTNGGYDPAYPSFWWNPSVVIPGLPAPHNGL